MKSSAFRSAQQSQRPILVESKGVCKCQSMQRRMWCVSVTGSSRIAPSFAQQDQTRSSSAKVSGLCSVIRLSRLRLWFTALRKTTSCPLTKSVNTISRYLLLRFVSLRAVIIVVRSELINLKVSASARKSYMTSDSFKHVIKLTFVCIDNDDHRMRLETVMSFLIRSSTSSLDIPSVLLSWISSDLSLLITSRRSPFKPKSLADCSAVSVMRQSWFLLTLSSCCVTQANHPVIF